MNECRYRSEKNVNEQRLLLTFVERANDQVHNGRKRVKQR